tara:strand:- start:122 stop:580 length:459 start_codon:yes stop_codon:yes gene_type:complete
MTTLNNTAASVMMDNNIISATDVTGFGLLGHLGNMLKASSIANQKKLGAKLFYSKIPFFRGVENLLNKGLCPSGSERNLKTAAPLTTFSADIGYNHQLLLADAQTSGGLLMSVPKTRLATLLTDLKNNSSVPCAVIGQVIQTNEPAQIQVES